MSEKVSDKLLWLRDKVAGTPVGEIIFKATDDGTLKSIKVIQLKICPVCKERFERRDFPQIDYKKYCSPACQRKAGTLNCSKRMLERAKTNTKWEEGHDNTGEGQW